MSIFGDIFSGLKQVMLLHENVSRLQQEVETMGGDLRLMREYVVDIDRRVARIEGVMEGYRRGAEDAQGRLPPT